MDLTVVTVETKEQLANNRLPKKENKSVGNPHKSTLGVHHQNKKITTATKKENQGTDNELHLLLHPETKPHRREQ
jgi:hypothetical protein